MSETDNLRNIREVTEQVDYRVVNIFLAKGWELLATRVENGGDVRPVPQRTVYILGWRGERGEPVHPTTEDYHAVVYGYYPSQPSAAEVRAREMEIRERAGF